MDARSRSTRRVLPALALASLIGCSSLGIEEGGFNLISLDEEWAMRDDLRRQVETQKRVVRDAQANAYIERLGRQLVAKTALGNRPWDFGIVDEPTLNAFNLPGGLVYVHTGLIREADTLDQLAGVLAHEIGHGVARHGTQLMTRAYGLELLASIALGSDPSQAEQVLAQVVGTGVLNRYSREAEREADALGVRTAHSAGIDPRGLPDFFRTLQERRQRDPSEVEQFFASHPLDAERIRDTEALIAELPARRSLLDDTPEYQRFRSRFR
jgi:predicted Zn-dependent protease